MPSNWGLNAINIGLKYHQVRLKCHHLRNSIPRVRPVGRVRGPLAASKFRPYRQTYAMVGVLRLLTLYCIVTQMLDVGRGQSGYSRRWGILVVGVLSSLGYSRRWGTLAVRVLSPLGCSRRWGTLVVGALSSLGCSRHWGALAVGLSCRLIG